MINTNQKPKNSYNFKKNKVHNDIYDSEDEQIQKNVDIIKLQNQYGVKCQKNVPFSSQLDDISQNFKDIQEVEVVPGNEYVRSRKLKRSQIMSLRNQFEQALHLKKGELTSFIFKIGAKYCVNYHAIHKIYQQWREDPTLSKYQEQNDTIALKNPTKLVLATLHKLIEDNPLLSFKEIIQILQKVYPQRTRKFPISRLLSLGGFMVKRSKNISEQRNAPQFMKSRFQYCAKYRYFSENNFNIFFCDEILLNKFLLRETGIAKKNESVALKQQNFLQSSVSLLCLMGNDGSLYWDLSNGNNQKEDYCTRFYSLLKNIDIQSGQKKVIIFRQISFRKISLLCQLARRTGWSIEKLSPHSHLMSPLNYLFSELTLQLIKKMCTIQPLKIICTQTVSILKKSSKAKCLKTYQKINPYLTRALMSLQF